MNLSYTWCSLSMIIVFQDTMTSISWKWHYKSWELWIKMVWRGFFMNGWVSWINRSISSILYLTTQITSHLRDHNVQSCLLIWLNDSFILNYMIQIASHWRIIMCRSCPLIWANIICLFWILQCRSTMCTLTGPCHVTKPQLDPDFNYV